MKRFTKFALVFVAIVVTFLAVSVYAASVTQTASAVNTQLSPSDWKDKIIAAVSALTKTDVPAIITSLNSLDNDAVTNASAQTATVAGTVTPQAGATVTATAVVTPQAGPDVTATAVVTPQAGPTVTATAVNTPQTGTITVTLSPQTVDVTNAAGGVSAVWTNATASFTGMTNATIVVTVANGAGLLTNATAAVTVANGAGLLTNATAAITVANGAGLLTNVTVSTAGVTTNVLNQR